MVSKEDNQKTAAKTAKTATKTESKPSWLDKKEEYRKEEKFTTTGTPWFNLEKDTVYHVVFDIEAPAKVQTHWTGERRIMCKGEGKCQFNHQSMKPDLTWTYKIAIFDEPSGVFILYRMSVPARAGFVLNRIIDHHGKMGILYHLFKTGEGTSTIYALKVNANDWKGKDPFNCFLDKEAAQDTKEVYLESVNRDYVTDQQFKQLDLIFNYTNRQDLQEIDEDIPF